jgi:hypothetical protein
MFGRKAPVASVSQGGQVTYDAINPVPTANPDDQIYSPSEYAFDPAALGLPDEHINQLNNAGLQGSGDGGFWQAFAAQGKNLYPPQANVGGEAGVPDQLGWSTGIWQMRFKQPITGRTLVPPATRPHPAVGPVGKNDHMGRLQQGVQSLRTTYTPTAQQAGDVFLNIGKQPLRDQMP